jgi:hypothetical protein
MDRTDIEPCPTLTVSGDKDLRHVVVLFVILGRSDHIKRGNARADYVTHCIPVHWRMYSDRLYGTDIVLLLIWPRMCGLDNFCRRKQPILTLVPVTETSWIQNHTFRTFIHSATCHMTGPQCLPKAILYPERYSASSLIFKNPLFSRRTSTSYLGFFFVFLSLLSFPSSFVNNVFQKAIPKQDVSNQISLPPFHLIYSIPLLNNT